MKVISHNKGAIGGWLEKGRYYWDAVVIISDREKAIELGKKRKQIAIYDLDKSEAIRIEK